MDNTENKNINNVLLTQRSNAGTGIQLKQNAQKKSLEEIKIKFPECETPLVSVIVVAHNQFKYTKNCLFRVSKNIQNFEYEVILVDDCSNDETKNIKKDIENITIIKNPKPIGYVKSVNLAAKKAKGEFLCLLNNDTSPNENFLKFLLEPMQNEKIGIVTAKICTKEKLILQAGGAINQRGVMGNYGLFQNSDNLRYNLEKTTEVCYSTCMLVRKNAWDNVGGFDEKFSPANYHDADLCYTFKYKIGLDTYYKPQAEVIDFQKSGFKKENIIFKNYLRFHTKWKKQIQDKFKDNQKIPLKINICYGIIDKLSQHAGCSIASILINSNLNDKYHFYIISDFISEKNKEYFEKLKSIRDFELTFINISDEEFKDLPDNEYGYAPYYRFKILDLIKEDKVLYLDSDTTVRKDLHELFETDISNYYCAAAPDADAEGFKKLFNLKKDATYVNSGVLLLNVKKCRQDKILDKLYKTAKKPPREIICLDQDIINLVMQTKIKIIDLSWNCMFPYYKDIQEKYEFYFQLAIDPGIMHYISKEKPWNKEETLHKKYEYFEYLRYTPWYKEFMEFYNS